MDNGDSEKKLAEKYKINADEIRVKYPKSAEIFDEISQRYFEEAEHERARAENGI